MNIWYFYFLLPAIFFPLTLIIATSQGRKIGARKLSLYRQLTVSIVWFPILLNILEKSDVLSQNILLIALCGIIGASYLTIAFYAVNLTTVWISRSFVTVSRTICSFLVWYFLFQENISYFDILWVGIIFLWVYKISNISKEKLSKKDILGIILSFTWWILFTFNNLVFKKIWENFSMLESAYILEASSLIPLTILYAMTHKKEDFKAMRQDGKKIWILFFTAPLILLASYWLAQSVQVVPFYIFNTLFILVLIFSLIFWRIFLGEKISLARLWAMWLMIVWCSIIMFA